MHKALVYSLRFFIILFKLRKTTNQEQQTLETKSPMLNCM